jgi:hypothetical protein
MGFPPATSTRIVPRAVALSILERMTAHTGSADPRDFVEHRSQFDHVLGENARPPLIVEKRRNSPQARRTDGAPLSSRRWSHRSLRHADGFVDRGVARLVSPSLKITIERRRLAAEQIDGLDTTSQSAVPPHGEAIDRANPNGLVGRASGERECCR